MTGKAEENSVEASRMSSDHAATPAPVLATDPVCGMSVDPAHAAGSTVHQGQTYYFCSTHCLHQFEADPPRYVGSRPAEWPAAPASSGVVYTCPMHPEV